MEFTHEIVMPNTDLNFRMFRFEVMHGNYSVSKHWHHSVELFAVIEGEIEFYINAKEYHLGKGHVLIVNSNEIHSIVAPDPNFVVVLQIPFCYFEEYCDGGYLYFEQEKLKEDMKIYPVIKEMYEVYCLKEYGYKARVNSVFYQLIYQLITKYKAKSVGRELIINSQNLNQLSKITAYIKEYHAQHITLESLGAKFGFSPTYLSRMFQKNAGINFKTYIQNVRVGYAYKELLNTDHTIGDIALNNGFANMKSFSHEFKKRYGMLPSVYRKTVNEQEKIRI